nr:hypothetical protein RVX_3007 [Nitratidesulfovibrio sp. HK-II]
MYPLDFVMPPAGRGCCNEHPLHPRVPFVGSFPSAQDASGRSARRKRQCAHGSRRHHRARVPLFTPLLRRMCHRLCIRQKPACGDTHT